VIFKTYPQTPPDTARQIINLFTWRKGETVLEPCRGEGAFYRQLPLFVKKEWCEILEGRNFFDYRGSVDSIITNPPYDNLATFIASLTTQVDQAAFGRRFAGRAGTGKCSTR
jgi:tRNA G10  N-methylase Trm11